MNLATRYYEAVTEQLKRIVETQQEPMARAAEGFADALTGGGWVYLFGSGHSHMLAEELFYRAGGFARIVPILHERLMLHVSAVESTQHERDVTIVPELLEKYPLTAKDVLVVISNSGRNPVPIELAQQGRQRGVRVIALVNVQQTREWPSRHASGKDLTEVADVVLDNCGAVGDACVPVERLGTAFGPASTMAGCLILQMVAAAALEKLLERGIEPEVFCSSNTTGDVANQRILAKYRGHVPHL